MRKPRPFWRAVAAVLCALTAVVATASSAAAQPPGRTPPPSTAAAHPPSNDLDAFMARVLQRRDENWRKLHDYILSETESFGIEGPGKLPLNGFKREYIWYVRDGFLIRSPVRYDGVATPEPERRKYEEDWLEREKERDERARFEGEGRGGRQASRGRNGARRQGRAGGQG